MLSQITTRTHPNLTAAERRAERARTEGAAWKITHLEMGLTRHSDGKHGGIRFALVYSQPGQDPYTVRLRNDGTPCRCSCRFHEQERERHGVCAEECKHMARVRMCGGVDQEPGPVALSAPFDMEREAAEAARLERAEADRKSLWEDHPAL